jgi:aspartate/methionine/tyrosine aminotransferase
MIPEMIAIYKRKMTFLHERITGLGLTARFPDGTYYLWTDVGISKLDDVAFVALAQSEGVRVNPGTAFGPGGTGYLRLSCTPTDAQLEEGVRRLARAIERAKTQRGAPAGTRS